jgi:hypothetical protein
LRVDPPPDLVIEVVETHPADAAIEVYRRIRVPEVWICGPNELTILQLNASGRYVSAERSLAFPILTAAEIHSWIIREQENTDTDWIKALRRWVLEVLVPRHRELSKENPQREGKPL